MVGSHINMKKYNNIPKICNLGHKHPSIGECRYCTAVHLLLLAPSEGLKSIIYEKSYTIELNGSIICKHKPDFTLVYHSGKIVVHEYKGFATPLWKLKRKMFIAMYPHIDYITIYK